ncbi:MAG: KEOPS complex subunit Pcc1 [Candidatus Poseidoniia archaeon]|nr:KEOPS complex subunit Pcc1 [Candidatus Poseidoniia archaeon]
MKYTRLEILSNAIDIAVKDSCNKAITVAFSGGIDSTLVAFLAKKYSDVELIAVGTPKSHDLEAAKTAAEMIEMDLTIIEIEPKEMVIEGFNMQKEINLKAIEVEFMLPFWIAAKNSKNSILMCGQGADELFGGYARFRKEGIVNDLSKEVDDLNKRLKNREKKITEIFDLELSCPYLSENVVEAANSFSDEERIGDVGKVPLRQAAQKLGLPKEIANRKKKAAQYGSGSQKAIRDIIKHKIELEIVFDSNIIAKSVAKSTEPENIGWVETNVVDNKIKAIIKAENLGSLREATEDFMACVSVAEKVTKQ